MPVSLPFHIPCSLSLWSLLLLLFPRLPHIPYISLHRILCPFLIMLLFFLRFCFKLLRHSGYRNIHALLFHQIIHTQTYKIKLRDILPDDFEIVRKFCVRQLQFGIFMMQCLRIDG